MTFIETSITSGDDDLPLVVKSPATRRKLSWVRVLLALVVVAGAVAAVRYMNERRASAAAATSGVAGWSAPYVDVTVTPFFGFEDPGPGVEDVVLSFVVADADDPCRPAWGSVFDLDEAAVELDLDRRVVRLRQTGGDLIVSFGGAINDELATSCESVEQLAAAYLAVIERYELVTVDFDIEGPALTNAAANARRAEALASIQHARRADGHELAVWLTLPIGQSGLTPEGVAVVEAMLAGGVELAGVNAMTMNYGVGSGADMGAIAIGSLEELQRQLVAIWRRAGFQMAPGQAWGLVGATPMIGRNDVAGEHFGLDDAARLADFAADRGIGRLGYWSLNRDRPCSPSEAPLAGPSNGCAHVDQEPNEFALAFDVLGGRASDAAGVDRAAVVPDLVEDDPDRSPYQLWDQRAEYLAGEKVVWHGYVYEAKWWTSGDDPEAPVLQKWETPWHVIGPVLEADLIDPIVIPEDFAPQWDGQAIYNSGDRVMFDGEVYEARWWNEGFQPDRGVTNPWDSPWVKVDARDLADELGG